jgi:Cytochrome c554 and c-prime
VHNLIRMPGILCALILFMNIASAFLTPARGQPADANRKLGRPQASYEPQIQHPGGLTVFFSGARRSKIVPCGCQGRNLGGIDKEGAVIAAVRKVTSPTLNLDAGGFLEEFTDYELRMQSWYLLEALRYLQVNAMNVSYTELQHGIDALQRLQAEFRLPLISANIIDTATRKPFFETHKIINVELPNGQPVRVGIVGVTASGGIVSRAGDENFFQKASPLITGNDLPAIQDNRPDVDKWLSPAALGLPRRGIGGAAAPEQAAGGMANRAMRFALDRTTPTITRGKYEVLDEITAIRELAEKLRSETDVMILLAYAGPGRTHKIVEAVPLFDIVISGDAYQRYEPFFVGVNNNILFAAAEHDGRFIGKIEVAMDADGTVSRQSAEMIPIDQHYHPDPRLTELIDLYLRDKGKLPKISKVLEKIYAGANRCNSCHAGEFAQWNATRHASAMKTLRGRKMHNAPECLKCHTTAFGAPGGFTDLLVTAHLANVQCESCHGPGQKHMEEEKRISALSEAEKLTAKRTEKLILRRDAKFCMECHDAKNDPDFNFARDIRLVDHSTTPPAHKENKPDEFSLHPGN